MLTEIRLSRLGVITEAVVPLGAGFTAITGETGAGKTMIVTGLGLLLGGKAEARLIRHGEIRARVESRWQIADAAAESVAELGGEVEAGEVLVSRVLTPARSSAFLGGAQVPVKIAGEFLAELLTIHGQSEQLRLGTPERQREVLDRFAGGPLARVLGQYEQVFVRRKAATKELADLQTAADERARELDMLLFGLDEIAAVGLEADEDLTLQAEWAKLNSVEDLQVLVGRAVSDLGGDDADGPSAYGLVVSARQAVSSAESHDAGLADLAAQLTEIEYALGDALAAVASYSTGLEPDPARLDWVAARMGDLQRLTRKYGASVGEVLDWEQKALERVAVLRGGDERISVLATEIAADTEQLTNWASEIHELRVAAATKLASLVSVELAALAMPNGRIMFEVASGELGPHGADTVALLFAANAGAGPGPLAKIASGGELSRVRLALEVVLADGAAGTFVFDEVDAGVGGAVALEIGRRLRRLAEHAQVIVVTHLAQVAAFADAHLVVRKSDDGQVTSSDIEVVSADDRAVELARMMAGLDSEVSLEHARELLAVATS